MVRTVAYKGFAVLFDETDTSALDELLRDLTPLPQESRAARTFRDIFESGRPLIYVRSTEEQRVLRVLRETAARMPVAKNPETRAGETNVLGSEERKPTEDGGIGEKLPAIGLHNVLLAR